MRRIPYVVSAVLLSMSGCTSKHHDTELPQFPDTTPPASVTPPSCGTTQAKFGIAPAWTVGRGVDHPSAYVVSANGDAVGFYFADSLRTGRHDGSNNKILWIIRTPTADKPLMIDAHPVGAPTPVVHHEEPGIGAGDYPTIIDEPTAGCWHLDLSWNGYKDSVELPYLPPQ